MLRGEANFYPITQSHGLDTAMKFSAISFEGKIKPSRQTESRPKHKRTVARFSGKVEPVAGPCRRLVRAEYSKYENGTGSSISRQTETLKRSGCAGFETQDS